jgi:hypothetical protein
MNWRRLYVWLTLLVSMVLLSQSAAWAQGVQLFAVLNGGNEVSNAGDANVGDQNGWGSATVIIRNADTICFAILVTGIAVPTVAHIHENTAGQNGPVVIPLVAPDSGNPGTSAGCVSELDPALVRRLRLTPSRFYVNVHNDDFPGGAVRGQLF